MTLMSSVVAYDSSSSSSGVSNSSMISYSSACWPPSDPPGSISSSCGHRGVCMPKGTCLCDVDYIGRTCMHYWRDSSAWLAYRIIRYFYVCIAFIIWCISTQRWIAVVRARHCRSAALAAAAAAAANGGVTHTHAHGANGAIHGMGTTSSGPMATTPNSVAIAAHTATANHNNLLIQNVNTARLFTSSTLPSSTIVQICGCEWIAPSCCTRWLTQQVLCLTFLWISSTFG
jgi:hypothetical protein